MTIERTTSWIYGLVDKEPVVLSPGTVENRLRCLGSTTLHTLSVIDDNTVEINDALGLSPGIRLSGEKINSAWLTRSSTPLKKESFTWRSGVPVKEHIKESWTQRPFRLQTRKA